MEDIKITEGTILESLNNKADIDGGNYKGSGLQAVLEETTLGTAGGTMNEGAQITLQNKDAHTYCGITVHNKFADATQTSLSAQENYMIFRCADKSGKGVGEMLTKHTTSGAVQSVLRAFNITSGGQAELNVGIDSNNNQTFAFPKCTTKATTTSSAASNKVAVIVQNYKSGTSWYRVWSDGWIEQGGCTSSITSDALQTVTFTKAFTAVPYVNPICRETVGETGEISTHLGSVTTKNFTCKIRRLSGSGTDGGVINWYACGY